MDRLNLLPTIANITSALSKGVQKDSHPQSGYKASKNSRRKESLSFPRELREEKDNIFLVLSFFSLVCLLACLLALGFFSLSRYVSLYTAQAVTELTLPASISQVLGSEAQRCVPPLPRDIFLKPCSNSQDSSQIKITDTDGFFNRAHSTAQSVCELWSEPADFILLSLACHRASPCTQSGLNSGLGPLIAEYTGMGCHN